MSVSVTDSDQASLLLIWDISLVLVVLSFAVLFALIIARAVSAGRDKDLKRRKEDLSRYIYAALSSPVAPTADSLPRLSMRDQQALTSAALDLMRSLKGEDRKRIAALLQVWNIDPYLRKLLKGARGHQIQALTVLWDFEDEKSKQTLLEYSDSPDIYVQLAALQGLAARGAIESIDVIIQSLTRTSHTNILMMSDILARFGEPAVPYLAGLSKTHPVKDVRVATLLALGTIHSLQAYQALMELLDDGDADIRAQAAIALGKIGDIRANHKLIDLLDDENKGVRVQATQALGLIGHPDSIGVLTKKLDDTDWWVRFRAAEALHMQGAGGIALLQAVSTQDGPAGDIAWQVLQERGGGHA